MRFKILSGAIFLAAFGSLPSLGAPGNAFFSLNDPCDGYPTPGTVCRKGTIYLGTLSPGATSGTGTDRYMIAPGGCADIPAGQIGGGTAPNTWPNADFTPTCTGGTDTLTKPLNDGSTTYFDNASIPNFVDFIGTGFGATNTDSNYGQFNTTQFAATTLASEGGYYAAPRYCDRFSYGGYTDWYLPNRYELNLMFTNKAFIPSLALTDYYRSTTESGTVSTWVVHMDTGDQQKMQKQKLFFIRCVRRY